MPSNPALKMEPTQHQVGPAGFGVSPPLGPSPRCATLTSTRTHACPCAPSSKQSSAPGSSHPSPSPTRDGDAPLPVVPKQVTQLEERRRRAWPRAGSRGHAHACAPAPSPSPCARARGAHPGRKRGSIRRRPLRGRRTPLQGEFQNPAPRLQSLRPRHLGSALACPSPDDRGPEQEPWASAGGAAQPGGSNHISALGADSKQQLPSNAREFNSSINRAQGSAFRGALTSLGGPDGEGLPPLPWGSIPGD